MTIWKYELEIEDEQAIEMPETARLLCVQMQGETLCLWAHVNPDEARVHRIIRMRGTGHRADAIGTYIGTVQRLLMAGALVFHVFDGGESE